MKLEVVREAPPELTAPQEEHLAQLATRPSDTTHGGALRAVTLDRLVALGLAARLDAYTYRITDAGRRRLDTFHDWPERCPVCGRTAIRREWRTSTTYAHTPKPRSRRAMWVITDYCRVVREAAA